MYSDRADVCGCKKPEPDKDGYKPSAPVSCSTLLGLTEDETRYFQWLLCKTLPQITDTEWKNLAALNQKILAAMALQSKA